MLLDAHGGAVAAGGHGLWSSALRAAAWSASRFAPLALRGREVLGLLLLLRRGASGGRLSAARLEVCSTGACPRRCSCGVYGAAQRFFYYRRPKVS